MTTLPTGANSGADDQDGSGSGSPHSKQGVPRGALGEAENLAKALWEAARLGAIPPEALARQLSGPTAKATGGAWRAKLALLRVFDLMTTERAQIRLSPIGLRIVRDHELERQEQARRDAVLGVRSYKEILTASDGAPLPTEASLAATFEYTYGLGRVHANKAAKDFVSSVRLARFIGDDDLVHLASQETAEPSAGDTVDGTHDMDEELVAQGTGGLSGAGTMSAPAVGERSELQPRLHTPPIAPAAITLTLDLSHFDADDVLRILHALGLSRDEPPPV